MKHFLTFRGYISRVPILQNELRKCQIYVFLGIARPTRHADTHPYHFITLKLHIFTEYAHIFP